MGICAKNLDLDDFINSVCRKIGELEIIYHQIEKECEDEMVKYNVECVLMELFPIFSCMHSDSVDIFVDLILGHYKAGK